MILKFESIDALYVCAMSNGFRVSGLLIFLYYRLFKYWSLWNCLAGENDLAPEDAY